MQVVSKLIFVLSQNGNSGLIYHLIQCFQVSGCTTNGIVEVDVNIQTLVHPLSNLFRSGIQKLFAIGSTIVPFFTMESQIYE